MNRVKAFFVYLREQKYSGFEPFIFFAAFIIYLEAAFKIAVFKSFLNVGLVFMVLFSLPLAFILHILCTCFQEKVNKTIAYIVTLFITLIYIVQVVYYHIFSTFLALFSINGTGQVLQFWQEIVIAIQKSIFLIVFLMLPLLVLITRGRRFIHFKKSSWGNKASAATLAVVLQICTTVLVTHTSDGELSTGFLYSKTFVPVLSVERFGLLTTTRLDMKHLLIGSDTGEIEMEEDKNTAEINEPQKAEIIEPDVTGGSIGVEAGPSKNEKENQEKKQEYNIMNIDFDRLIAGETDQNLGAMHSYFKAVKPTAKNKYTGSFKGKNLIMITAEGFSPYAVDKNLTPTLYKLWEEGFQFTNFYTPIWGISTSDGEYVACNSLIPKTGVWSFYLSGKNYMPFCMGNQLKKLGYGTRAYHDHTYTYYHREISHPNMGYDFKAVGNGLDMKKTWPESDVEMIEKTVDDYIGSTPFHTYYMTVSGHLRYSFEGNAMASKNRSLVKDLPYSEAVKAYLACNIEFDRAMEKLLTQLEQAGIAENTVIAISPDHYPYGLTEEQISELAGHKVEKNFELYKGIFILWTKGMKPEKIDKPCSSMDILPTISNLMGIEYDSRLLMGRDIFSDAPPLVIFSNLSWITDKASYNSMKKKVIPVNDTTLDAAYSKEITKQVNAMFRYSAKILETNYYDKIFRK